MGLSGKWLERNFKALTLAKMFGGFKIKVCKKEVYLGFGRCEKINDA
jgi:hypothetical protein